MRTLAAALLLISSQMTMASDTLLGFTVAGSEDQRALEARIDAGINAEEMDAWMRRLTQHPHHVGSPVSLDYARYMAGLLEVVGL